jgi:hypothetical protein
MEWYLLSVNFKGFGGGGAVGTLFKLLSRHSSWRDMRIKNIIARIVGLLTEIRTGWTYLPNAVQDKHVISWTNLLGYFDMHREKRLNSSEDY